MKRLLLGIGVVAGLLVGAFLVGMVALPRDVRVARSVTIDAPQETVFGIINGFDRFNEWSPWYPRDPSPSVYTVSGPATGVGARMTWDSDVSGVGSGSQEIIASEPDRRIRTELRFGGFDRPSYAELLLEPVGDGVKATWTMEADMGVGPGRWIGLLMDAWVGADYETGLANLKRLAEAETDR